MRSLQTRLFVYHVVGAALLLLVTGLALLWTIAAWLQHEFDRGLETKARTLITLTEQERGRVEMDFEVKLMPEFGDASGPEYFELRLADGSLVQRSPSFEMSEATRRASLLSRSGPATTPRFHDHRLPDGRRGRQVRIEFVPNPDAEDTPGAPATGVAGPVARPLQSATLIVARERERLDSDLRRLALGVGILGVVLVAALAGLTQAALRVGLRSLERLTRQVRSLGVTSLATRVEVPAPPEEIAVVVDQVNALLDRLEAGFARERRLSSDIAHELKTPIAELRTLCEVGARWPDDGVAVREFFADAHAIARSLERVVTHLVALARYDEGREPVFRTPVPVAEIVAAAWKPLASKAASRRLQYRQEISPALRFDTDPDKFQLIVSNLLSNAVDYGSPGTGVVCVANETNGRPSVSFSNRAENLEAGDLAVMFDRFWRKDESRAGGQHVGLGLSLVRAMADLLAIEVDARLEPDGTFRVTLRGPAPHQNRNCTMDPTSQEPLAMGNAAPGKK